jgi:pimeloyl-ACP methyl ester carboxylesterase
MNNRKDATMRKIMLALMFLSMAAFPGEVTAQTPVDSAVYNILKRADIQGTHSDYHGFDCCDFTFEGRDAKIVRPLNPAPGRPWLWRMRFWGHEPQTELALLSKGFHLVYCDAAELFGNAENIALWDHFYRMLAGAGLAPKAAYIGFSRGGLYTYLWALAYPERVACVYVDAPSLDFKSWPGRGGELWGLFKKNFGFASEEEALAWRGNPLDRAAEIAAGGYPMLHICGLDDVSVPIAENTNPFEKKILEAGGSITVIRKPGVGHHPHSLVDPTPIVEFILRATGQQ